MDLTDEIVTPPVAGARRIPAVLKVLGVVVGVLTVVIVAAAFIQVPYYLVSPGSARATEPLIEVEGAASFQHVGQVEFATVSLQKATAMQALMGWLDPTVDVVDAELVEGDRTPSEVRQINLEAMATSKDVATAVALDQLGYEVTETGSGAQILQVGDGSPADGVVEVGDVVVEAGGRPIRLNTDLTTFITSQRPGDQVDLVVKRLPEPDPQATEEDETPTPIDVALQLTLGANPDDPDVGFMGVSTRTWSLQYQFPFIVTIDSGGVGGPSAGLAFTLGVMDTLSPDSITGGRRIATTGTMRADGSVGPVGGVSQKTVAVRRSGAELFLVPSSEYEQAKKFAGRMQVVPVDTLDQALAALAAFRDGSLSVEQASAPG